jgi:hypothetical protein
MSHYAFAQTFRTLYDKAVALYAKGASGADTYFTADESAWLVSNGITAQYLYDYAEDQNGYGEPGYDIALGVELVRRDYFLNVQHGKPTGKISNPNTWPGKDMAVKNIAWLPRILPKARAKLLGELPASMMYGCAGDRKFFKTHDINPVEFLSLVWRNFTNDEAVIEWVVKRSASKA